jgi:hypothetical protein
MENVYNIWKTGHMVRTSLGVILVGETERAYKFKVLNSEKEYYFFMPKKAVKFDTKLEGTINLARWFTVDGFLRFLFDRYASHYKR